MSERYCVCKKPNTRQIAFARANAFDCPDCGRTLNPDPSAEANPQVTSTSEPNSRPLSPDSYPSTLSALRSVRGFTPPPSELQPVNQIKEPNDRENRTSSQWPTPPPVEHPSQVRAGTPTKIIEIAPDESTTDANRRDDSRRYNRQELLLSDNGDAAWDRLDEEFGEFNELDDDFEDINTEIEGDSLHDISNHSYQSLLPDEDNNFPQLNQDHE